MKNRMILPVITVAMLMSGGCEWKEYPTYKYDITNGLGEHYIVNYTEQSGYPENGTRVKVFLEKDKIADFDGGDYTNYSNCIPSQVLYLFTGGEKDYYYMLTPSDSYIITDVGVMLSLDVDYAALSTDEAHTYLDISKIMRDNVTSVELDSRFQNCGYDSSKALRLYNYAE